MNQLEYQLDILKLEIETINGSIRQMDAMTEKIKDWAIVTWAAALGATITTPTSLNKYIAFTAAIPIAFWFTDGWYRRIQRRFIWRTNQIGKFLNEGGLAESFKQDKIVNEY